MATTCPVSREEFHRTAGKAKVTIEVGGEKMELTLDPRDCGTGSFGFGYNGRVEVKIGSHAGVAAMLGLNLTLVGSKRV